MDTDLIIVIIQFTTVLITILSAIILYKTITNNKQLNQNTIFNEIIKHNNNL